MWSAETVGRNFGRILVEVVRTQICGFVMDAIEDVGYVSLDMWTMYADPGPSNLQAFVGSGKDSRVCIS